MKSVDSLLRMYPPSWRARHGDEFRDALSSTISSSGRLPTREVRSAIASALRERARGDSTTSRALVRSALHDSLIFVSGLIVGMLAWSLKRNGLPSSLYPSTFVLLPLAVFIASTMSSQGFRIAAIASGPTLWVFANTFEIDAGGYQARTHVAPNALGMSILGLLSFLGLALAIRHRWTAAALLQAPTVIAAVYGAVTIWRANGFVPYRTSPTTVRMAWVVGFLAVLLAATAVATIVTRRTFGAARLRWLHVSSLAIGCLMSIAPGPTSLVVGAVVLVVAWWNPRPALVVLTWPVAMVVGNLLPSLWINGGDVGSQFRWLIPTAAAVVLAVFLRHSVNRVHRYS